MPSQRLPPGGSVFIGGVECTLALLLDLLVSPVTVSGGGSGSTPTPASTPTSAPSTAAPTAAPTPRPAPAPSPRAASAPPPPASSRRLAANLMASSYPSYFTQRERALASPVMTP